MAVCRPSGVPEGRLKIAQEFTPGSPGLRSPGGTTENSPGVHSWVGATVEHASPGGTTESLSIISRHRFPTGRGIRRRYRYPALKCWAIFGHPYGMPGPGVHSWVSSRRRYSPSPGGTTEKGTCFSRTSGPEKLYKGGTRRGTQLREQLVSLCV